MPRTIPDTTRPTVLADVVNEAAGHRRRVDPVLPKTGGPAGNARLSAWTGLVLLVLIAAELVTLLDVDGLLAWHAALGTTLLVTALVKAGSTGWRVVRYYRNDPHYRSAGPPPLLLRLLGPLVVGSTLALVGSGLLLIALGAQSGRRPFAAPFGVQLDWVTVHQALFFVFAAAAGLHLLARLVPALQLTVIPRLAAETVPGGRRRVALAVLAAVVAIVGVLIVVSAAHGWHGGPGQHGRPPFGPRRFR